MTEHPRDVPGATGGFPAPPSGAQYVIEHGEHQATITQVGATLRSFRVGRHEALDGFDEHERSADGRGQVLAPWPNRIAEGRYRYGGRECQAPLNEPSRQDAIHGLVRWLEWTPAHRDASAVSLTCALRPQPGYEWQLELAMHYRVDDAGLTVRLDAVNSGPERAPFGAGFHPYLSAGNGSIEHWELDVPASHYLDMSDPDRIPPALPVAGERDFTAPRRIDGTRLDTAFGGLIRGADGRAVATLRDPRTARTVQLWVDESFGYLMVYTADDVGAPARRRTAVAIEPMSCPPDAFRSGASLVELDPGESWTGQWGLRVS